MSKSNLGTNIIAILAFAVLALPTAAYFPFSPFGGIFKANVEYLDTLATINSDLVWGLTSAFLIMTMAYPLAWIIGVILYFARNPRRLWPVLVPVLYIAATVGMFFVIAVLEGPAAS